MGTGGTVGDTPIINFAPATPPPIVRYENSVTVGDTPVKNLTWKEMARNLVFLKIFSGSFL